MPTVKNDEYLEPNPITHFVKALLLGTWLLTPGQAQKDTLLIVVALFASNDPKETEEAKKYIGYQGVREGLQVLVMGNVLWFNRETYGFTNPAYAEAALEVILWGDETDKIVL